MGSKVTDLRPGDAVVGTMPMKTCGAFAPRLVAPRGLVVRKPDALSFAEAATLPIAGVTAWQALVQYAGLARGQRVFINGASGAVGRAAIDIARHLGAEVVGRVGPHDLSAAAAIGLGRAVPYTEPPPHDLDGTFDLVFDVNGSLSPGEGDRLAKCGGKVIDIVPTSQKFLRALFSPSRKVLISSPKADNLQAVVDLAAARKLAIPIVQTMTLADAPRSLAAFERGEPGQRSGGKVVIAF